MANNVRISIVAPRPPTGNPGTGQSAVDRMITFWREKLAQVLPDAPDLIVVPEACDRFPEQSLAERLRYYRARGNRVRDMMGDLAADYRCYIAYSASREMPDGSWRNSTQVIDRYGEILGVYDKNHLVVTEIDAGCVCGRDAPIIACDFGRVACAICFDLNFDDLRCQYVASRPDLILFSSMYHGGLMQSYWAYSCRAHLVTAVAGLQSGILSPVGHVIASNSNYFDFVTATVNLDCKVVHLDFNWDKLSAMKEKYGVDVTVFDPGLLGAVLITSETDAMTSDDLIAEFGIELLDGYWERSLAAQRESRSIGQG